MSTASRSGGNSGTIRPGEMVLNSYRIVREIARGGMGALYEGRHDITGERVAIKSVLDQHEGDSRALRLFEREATALSKVRHEAIVHYRDILRDDRQRLFIIMDFIDGELMSRYTGRATLPPEGVMKLGARLSAGLAAAHNVGVAHRDIAPKNIMLPDGDIEKAVIIDFGIAKSIGNDEGTMIGDHFAGTIRYASPEQFGLFSGRVDQRSDIYSLGLVLAEIAGEHPNHGSTIGEASINRQHDVALPGIKDPALRARLEKMLKADPANRPSTMEEAWSGDVAPAPPVLVQDEITGPNPGIANGLLSTPPAKPEKQRGFLVPALIVIFLAVIGGGAFMMFGDRLTGGNGSVSLSQVEEAKKIIEDSGSSDQAKLEAADRLVSEGGTDNLNVALAVYRALSKDGIGEASARFARMYDPEFYDSKVSPFSKSNPRQALRYYRLAAEQGHNGVGDRIDALEAGQ